MKSNFTSKVINNYDLVYYVTANADGKPAWYYIQVEEPKHNAFKKHIEKGDLDLANFGKILYSGWGNSAPDTIEALVSEQFAN